MRVPIHGAKRVLLVSLLSFPGPVLAQEGAVERCVGLASAYAQKEREGERLTVEIDSATAQLLHNLLAGQDSLIQETIQLCREATTVEGLDPKVRGNLYAQLAWVLYWDQPSYLPPTGGGADAEIHRAALGEALEAFRKAVELDRMHESAWEGMSKVLTTLERRDEALGAYRDHAALHGDDPGVQVELGRMLRERGETRKARLAFENAVRADPRYADGWLGLAQTSESDYDRWRAYRKYLAIPRFAPPPPMDPMLEGMRAMGEGVGIGVGGVGEAMGLGMPGEEEWELAPPTPDEIAEREVSLIQTRAIDRCAGAIAEEEGKGAACAEAMRIYREWTDSFPAEADGWSGLGRVLDLTGGKGGAEAYDRAESIYRPRLRGEPPDTAALRGLGTMRLWRERYEEALQIFERLAELQPGRPEPLGWLGSCAFGLGRYRAAAEAFDRAAKLDPLFFEGREREKRERRVALERS